MKRIYQLLAIYLVIQFSCIAQKKQLYLKFKDNDVKLKSFKKDANARTESNLVEAGNVRVKELFIKADFQKDIISIERPFTEAKTEFVQNIYLITYEGDSVPKKLRR